jgi:MinD superfamily P-loop ATPase
VISKSLNASGWHFPEIAPDHECAGCRLCAIICPEAAIEIEKITGLRHGALTRLKEGSEFKPLLHQLTALAQRQGHLTRQDIRKVCQPLLDKEEAIDLDDIVLLFKEKGIAVHG